MTSPEQRAEDLLAAFGAPPASGGELTARTPTYGQLHGRTARLATAPQEAAR
ncbi:hypothetical protein [Actinacidiphila oryziradicis]|uniref:hypothetical protein n=1 Tax=Actinacidiphila oryziradicis TaxID=2571141 RepID=UPI0023F09070|nr:hypothetical protein [Actinacidiphila oryziradicis]MCW2874230.1 hypothetical protein [Actinacidiphila oryziradicis]